MGLFKNLLSNYTEELEKYIIQIDAGMLDLEDIGPFLMKNKISEQEYNKVRIQAHKKRADAGSVESQYLYAILMEDQNKEDSLRYYLMAADQGYVEAMKTLANAYSEYGNVYGRGFGINPSKEFEWKKRAAETGDPDAICSLALEYSLGKIVEENEEEAERLYGIAAEKGYAKAYIEISMFPKYVNDREKRINLLRAALNCNGITEDEFSRATRGLGWCYLPSQDNPYSDSRLSAYCFSMGYILGDDQLGEKVRETGYQTKEGEWDKWLDDAKHLRFQP